MLQLSLLFLSFLLPHATSAQPSVPTSVVVRAGARHADASPPHYHAREIGRSAWGLAIPNDINDHGVVVGEMDWGKVWGGPRHAVVWEGGRTIDLTPDPAIFYASARGINDQGVVAGGYSTGGSFPSGGFRWHDGIFEVLPTFAPGQQSGYGVTERGYVLGRSMNKQFQVNATTWDPDLVETDLGTFGPGIGIAYDANGWDIVVGGTGLANGDYGAFVWSHGTLENLGVLPGYKIGVAYAINNHDEVVGFSGTNFDEHAIYWTRSTGMIDLGNLGYPLGARALDINDAGTIVGYSYAAGSGSFGNRVGVIWYGGVLYDLNTLLVDGDEWDLDDANGINEQGQIVGFGRHHGVDVAYALDPADTPTTTVLDPLPGKGGADNTIEVVGATPGAQVAVLYGPTSGESSLAECPGAVVEILAPRRMDAQADATGKASVTVFLPATLSGTRLLVQAVDLSDCDVSNLAVRTLD